MTNYEFSTKLNNRKNSAGVTVEKVRVWLEESTNNKFLSDNGFKRGVPVQIFTFINSIMIVAINRGLPVPDASIELAEKYGKVKKAKVAGKDDRALFDITRNTHQMPESFHPKNNARLVASISDGFITIKVKGE
tara:strand:- start:160 stop:561 length:402 start_codon:yes stop_codon:yes gene_type:complete